MVVSNFSVPEASGNFCQRGGRFGAHSANESMAPVFYKKVVFITYFNAGVRAVDDVDVAAVVRLHIVALNCGLAAVLAVDLDATLVRRLGDRGDEVADFLRLIWIAYVDRAHAGIEVGDEHDLLVEHRRHTLICGMRAEPTASLAEVSARLRDGEIRDHHGLGLDRHVDEPHDLALLLALIGSARPRSSRCPGPCRPCPGRIPQPASAASGRRCAHR